MNENFCKRSTKKDKKKNTENKFGKHTQRHVRKFETYKKKTETKPGYVKLQGHTV